MSNPIAVIDSGVGGLTVVQELMRQLPREEIVYFGDTARCPYGPRSRAEVRKFSYQLTDFLDQFNPKMLVIACNTATAVILEEMRESYQIPVIGVIHPGVRAAIKSTLSGRIGVIGTVGTINSELYETALKQIHPDLRITSLACPNLVPLVEQGHFNHHEAYQIVKEALKPLLYKEIDTLILGCTHYPLLSPLIQKVIGEEVKLISSADETAREISAILFDRKMFSKQFGIPHHQFFTSGEEELFQSIAETWLQRSVSVKHIEFS